MAQRGVIALAYTIPHGAQRVAKRAERDPTTPRPTQYSSESRAAQRTFEFTQTTPTFPKLGHMTPTPAI